MRTHTGNCNNGHTPSPSNTIGYVSTEYKSENRPQLLEENVNCDHSTSFVSKERIENLLPLSSAQNTDQEVRLTVSWIRAWYAAVPIPLIVVIT